VPFACPLIGVAEHDPVADERAQLGEQRPEAVHGQAVGRAVEAVLGAGRTRALRRGHRVDAMGWCLVPEQEGCPGPLEVPAHIRREQAQEQVSPHAVLPPVVDGPHLQVARLEDPEVALHGRQALVGEDHADRVEALG